MYNRSRFVYGKNSYIMRLVEAIMYIVTIILAYLIGSIPFGLIFTKLYKLGDIRSIGSGNIGATNALRTGNKKVAILTLLGDMLKGTLAVVLISIISSDPLIIVLHGFAAILGHIYSIFVNFKGGKGVATFIGVVLGFNAALALLFISSWLIIAWFFAYSSLAALVAIWLCSFTSVFLFTNKLISLNFIAIASIITFCHKDNIKRLYEGIEPKITWKN